ncbi:MAG: PF20097 family protein [Candidatus Roizmanbacteria bacterium]|nr:PF20097 family protein [Candidatus Roizmanbacteria bacterium]
MENKACPKCKGEMEEGVTKNKSAYAGKNEWGNQITPFGVGVTNPRDVSTYRCTSCGFLESYAK